MSQLGYGYVYACRYVLTDIKRDTGCSGKIARSLHYLRIQKFSLFWFPVLCSDNTVRVYTSICVHSNQAHLSSSFIMMLAATTFSVQKISLTFVSGNIFQTQCRINPHRKEKWSLCPSFHSSGGGVFLLSLFFPSPRTLFFCSLSLSLIPLYYLRLCRPSSNIINISYSLYKPSYQNILWRSGECRQQLQNQQ